MVNDAILGSDMVSFPYPCDTAHWNDHLNSHLSCVITNRVSISNPSPLHPTGLILTPIPADHYGSAEIIFVRHLY